MKLRDYINYFSQKYRELYDIEYFYSSHEIYQIANKIKILGMKFDIYKNFIDWLSQTNKLKNINFLPNQKNEYYSSNEFKDYQVVENLLEHEKLMELKRKIVSVCKKCNGSGYKINKKGKAVKRCTCLNKFFRKRKRFYACK